MTNTTQVMNERKTSPLNSIVGVVRDLVRAWNFTMPAHQTPAMTTKEHIGDLLSIYNREGLFEAVRYDLSLSFRPRKKERAYEKSPYFIPSHPINVKQRYDAWSENENGKVTPRELYTVLVWAVREGHSQYEDTARGIAHWYGFSLDELEETK